MREREEGVAWINLISARSQQLREQIDELFYEKRLPKVGKSWAQSERRSSREEENRNFSQPDDFADGRFAFRRRRIAGRERASAQIMTIMMDTAAHGAADGPWKFMACCYCRYKDKWQSGFQFSLSPPLVRAADFPLFLRRSERERERGLLCRYWWIFRTRRFRPMSSLAVNIGPHFNYFHADVRPRCDKRSSPESTALIASGLRGPSARGCAAITWLDFRKLADEIETRTSRKMAASALNASVIVSDVNFAAAFYE